MVNFPLPIAKVDNNRTNHPTVVTNEWGMSISIDGGPVCEVITAQPADFSFSDLLEASKIDILSFISLYHNGIAQNSTFAWLPSHAIEKQIKAYLIKSGKHTPATVRKFNHGVDAVWSEYKAINSIGNLDMIDEYVSEITKISTNVRYGEMIIGANDNILSGLIYVHTFLTKENEQTYNSTLYGWSEHNLRVDNLASFGISKEIFRIYLHLIIEHRLTVSPMGIFHPHKYHEIDNLKQNRRDADCPICCNHAKFDLSEIGLTTPYSCKLLAEYIKRQMIKAMLSSFYLKNKQNEFEKSIHGVGVKRGQNVNVHYGKPKP